MGQYKQNIQELSDIGIQQDSIIDELEMIEGELDLILP